METVALDFEDIRQTKEWSKYLAGAGWIMEKIDDERGNSLNVAIKKLPLWPVTVMKIQRNGSDPNWKQLKQLRKRYWSVYSIIEPLHSIKESVYRNNGYKQDRFPYLPSKTLVVDLTKSESSIWNKLSENAKRLIKKNKIEVEKVGAEEWLVYWKKWTKIWTLNLEEMKSMEKAFGKKVNFYIGKMDGEIQSGLLVVESKNVANYYQTWTSGTGKLTGAHFALVWEAMMMAKRKRLKYFDFEGIYDERWPQKRWRGFSEFKRKFGGEVVSLPGCFGRWL